MGGKISTDSAAIITNCGVTWSKSQFPDSTELVAHMISANTITGTFYVTITDLNPNSDYFVRAFATNVAGTGYGEPILITTEFEPDPNLPIDPDYPTTYYALDSVTLSGMRTAYAERNKYLTSSLNEFGFCAYGSLNVESPPFIGDFTEEEALNKVRDFLLLNPSETGVNNPDHLTLKSSTSSASYDGSLLRFMEFNNQIFDTIQFYRYSKKLIFRVKNNEVIFCNGNWYPEIYIPANFNFNQEQVKLLLIGRTMVFNYGWSGESIYRKISTENINSTSVAISLNILPVEFNNRIELRVVWRLYLPEVFNVLYVDVMTGEIVLKEPTVLS